MTPSEPKWHQIIKYASSQSSRSSDAIAMDLWEQLEKALVSIIGQSGFHSLYLRSIYVISPVYPWLSDVTSSSKEERFTALLACYEKRESSEATSANISLLIALTDTLVSVIGESLTLGILRSAWSNYVSDTVKKEVSQ